MIYTANLEKLKKIKEERKEEKGIVIILLVRTFITNDSRHDK